MARTNKYTDAQIVAALVEMKGMVYLAAQKIGCNPDTIYTRAKSSRAITNAMRTERGKVLDTAELRLYKAVVDGEPWAIRMALMTIGKARGYVERQEVRSVHDDEIDSVIAAELARVGRNGQAPHVGETAGDEDGDE